MLAKQSVFDEQHFQRLFVVARRNVICVCYQQKFANRDFDLTKKYDQKIPLLVTLDVLKIWEGARRYSTKCTEGFERGSSPRGVDADCL